MKRVLITGGAGFLGSHLTKAFLDRGDEVVAIDNLSSGRVENVAEFVGHQRFALHNGDIRRSPEVPGPFDLVFNFASPASPPFYMDEPFLSLETGSIGTQWALDVAVDNGARFVQASTSEVYGDPLVHPQVEEYWGNVNPVGPRSVYDEAKRYGEALTVAYARYRGLDAAIVRIFNTYGPKMRADDGRVVSNFINQAVSGAPLTVYGDGTQTRSFCYCDDLVRGIVAVGDSTEAGPLNLGNPGERTMLELAELVIAMTNSSSEVVFEPLPVDDPTRRLPDISAARRLLGWEPRIDLEEGLSATIDYFAGSASDGS